MNPVRKRKMLVLLFILSIFMLASALVLYALRQNINLFYTPTQVVKGEASNQHTIRIGGMVAKNSVVRGGADGLSVEFQLTDFNQTVTIKYHGILPDLFREGQGIVALGKLSDNRHFIAEEVLAKHDANYMPPEVKEALAKGAQPGVKKSA
ncbi:cytochrome c maturation protein CcmE [Legionella maceachernii]|uniref:Cytochrome c-type biogenesis protein CcmE n=1 Tax=Legionella maceachernii TaxID=466 RepID=A0A0W0WAR7_9GAMM|nr:cytochrome c maturation protein CcmE [Legionella maceachernii]KTD29410.1 cytochrome c-type biogenesis protein CcmE [Legionella maceachernii]SJZ95425.1 cytochrome c-type biogenesis protein CcmE [Legionella maceachernii]SUP03282.1 Heme chaperone CcmE [Legionella maceachernii]